MEDETPESKPAPWRALAALGAGVLGGDVLRGKAQDLYGRGLTQVVETAGTPLEEIASFTRQEVKDLIDFAAKQGVTVPMVSAGPVRKGGSYFLPPELPLEKILSKGLPDRVRPESHIGIGSASVPAVMHEIGHASPIMGSNSLRNAWHQVAGLTRNPAMSAIRALIGMNMLRESDPEEQSFAQANAPALLAASYAPVLLEEGRATANALLGARRFGPGVAAVAKQLAPAFGTYAAAAAGPVLGALLAQKIMQSLREQGEEKNASTLGKEVQSPGLLRAPASSAWRMGMTAPKPKTIKPNSSPTARAKDTPTAKPPSKTAFYSDVIKSMNNPQRGFRQSKPEG
jgi:hypothetical protein